MRMWQYNYSNSDYLQHYGILGMRWGIRRFQDKSGRLTAAGKKRYDEDTDGAMLDNFYSVNKKTEEVSGFAPWSDQGFLERFGRVCYRPFKECMEYVSRCR